MKLHQKIRPGFIYYTETRGAVARQHFIVNSEHEDSIRNTFPVVKTLAEVLIYSQEEKVILQ